MADREITFDVILDFKFEDAKSKFQKFKRDIESNPILLKVKLDEASLNDAVRKIEAKFRSIKPFEVKLDTKSAEAQIDRLMSRMQGNAGMPSTQGNGQPSGNSTTNYILPFLPMGRNRGAKTAVQRAEELMPSSGPVVHGVSSPPADTPVPVPMSKNTWWQLYNQLSPENRTAYISNPSMSRTGMALNPAYAVGSAFSSIGRSITGTLRDWKKEAGPLLTKWFPAAWGVQQVYQTLSVMGEMRRAKADTNRWSPDAVASASNAVDMFMDIDRNRFGPLSAPIEAVEPLWDWTANKVASLGWGGSYKSRADERWEIERQRGDALRQEAINKRSDAFNQWFRGAQFDAQKGQAQILGMDTSFFGRGRSIDYNANLDSALLEEEYKQRTAGATNDVQRRQATQWYKQQQALIGDRKTAQQKMLDFERQGVIVNLTGQTGVLQAQATGQGELAQQRGVESEIQSIYRQYTSPLTGTIDPTMKPALDAQAEAMRGNLRTQQGYARRDTVLNRRIAEAGNSFDPYTQAMAELRAGREQAKRGIADPEKLANIDATYDAYEKQAKVTEQLNRYQARINIDQITSEAKAIELGNQYKPMSGRVESILGNALAGIRGVNPFSKDATATMDALKRRGKAEINSVLHDIDTMWKNGSFEEVGQYIRHGDARTRDLITDVNQAATDANAALKQIDAANNMGWKKNEAIELAEGKMDGTSALAAALPKYDRMIILLEGIQQGVQGGAVLG